MEGGTDRRDWGHSVRPPLCFKLTGMNANTKKTKQKTNKLIPFYVCQTRCNYERGEGTESGGRGAMGRGRSFCKPGVYFSFFDNM